MNKWLVFGLLGLVAVGAAVMLISPPDTGADLPDAPARVEAPAQAADAPEDDAPYGLREDGTPKAGPNPINERLAERREAPDAVWFAEASGLWTLLRRDLFRVGEPAADELAKEAAALVGELREGRRVPDRADLADLHRRSAELARMIEISPWNEGEIGEHLASLRALDGPGGAR